MNLLDNLSSSRHHSMGNELGQEIRIKILILRFKGLKTSMPHSCARSFVIRDSHRVNSYIVLLTIK